MTEKTYLTAQGATRLREELTELTGPRRKDLAKRLRAAIEQGDLSENADYIAAKEEQGFLEGRIQELEAVLKDAIIVEETDKTWEKVDVGATVTIQEPGEPRETYQLVGVNEVDPQNGRISHESPIGKALMGARVGDQVSVETPAGPIHLEILEIS